MHKKIAPGVPSTLSTAVLTLALALAPVFLLTGCAATDGSTEGLEWFNLRPATEKAYGYSHAVRIGDDIKIAGAVSMDDAGNPTAPGDLLQQMKNCYSDLEKILRHYGCTFEDVVVENVFTTDMAAFLEHAAYRNEIYTTRFPTGTWLEVKGLALPAFLVEIELEVHKRR